MKKCVQKIVSARMRTHTRAPVCVCVCVYMGGSDNYKVWYKVSRKNSFFVAILTCVNAKYILSICF